MPRHDRQRRRGGLIGIGIRSLAGGVGLISESIKANKQSKGKDAETTAQDSGYASSDAPPSYAEAFGSTSGQDQYPADHKTGHLTVPKQYEVVEREDNLEEEWELDAAQDQIVGNFEDRENSKGTENLADKFIRNHPAPPYPQRGNLALPVVIPQRRPKDRARGFVKAYAPILENAGIDQETWLEFLDTFQKSSLANPWINAINMAQFATIGIHGFGIGLAVSYAISKVADATIELEGRRK